MNCPRRHTLTKQEILLGKGRAPGGEQEGKGTQENCSAVLGFYGEGISFWIVFSQSFWLRVLPGGAGLVQPRWMPERRILGGGRIGGVSFWPFSNSSGWWMLISVLCLPGPPVVKQMVTLVPGQGGQFQSVCFP